MLTARKVSTVLHDDELQHVGLPSYSSDTCQIDAADAADGADGDGVRGR